MDAAADILCTPDVQVMYRPASAASAAQESRVHGAPGRQPPAEGRGRADAPACRRGGARRAIHRGCSGRIDTARATSRADTPRVTMRILTPPDRPPRPGFRSSRAARRPRGYAHDRQPVVHHGLGRRQQRDRPLGVELLGQVEIEVSHENRLILLHGSARQAPAPEALPLASLHQGTSRSSSVSSHDSRQPRCTHTNVK